MKQVVNPIPPSDFGGYSMANSAAVRTDQYVFVRGTIARDPQTTQFVGGSIQEQARVVLESIKTILEAAGSSLDKVVSVTVYLTRREDFVPFDQVYRTYFAKDWPARTMIIAILSLEEALVEVSAIALA